MDKLEKLDSLLLQGRITKEEYNEQKALFADKIITHLENELAEAYELHDQAKGKDAHTYRSGKKRKICFSEKPSSAFTQKKH